MVRKNFIRIIGNHNTKESGMDINHNMFWKATSILLFFSLLTLSCSSPLKEKIYVKDSHSNSKPWEAYIEHISLDLSVDFEEKVISGKASLLINNKKSVNKLHLDVWGLKIDRITLGKDESPATYVLGEFVELHGSPLVVNITPETKTVNIYYATRPDAEGLDWVSVVQTAGGVHPFMYTQSQSILAPP